MPTQQDFLKFAAGPGTPNVSTQAAFAAASSTATGYVTGIASSALVNKAQRQHSIWAKVLGDFIVAIINQPVIDDGTTATILANFIASIQAIAAAYGGDMFKAQNLSGLANYATARANLGLGTAAVLNAGLSAGNVIIVSDADARFANITGDSFTGAVNGTSASFSSSVTAASFNTTSSERFKDNIAALSGADALSLLELIDVVSYTSKLDGADHLGVIAEALEDGPLAFAVQHNDEGLPISVDYQSLFALAIAGTRELRSQVASLSARMDAIEQRG